MSSLASIVQTLSILCCITLIIALLPSVYSGELFPWHPVLMAVGFLGFMCEGIVTAYKLRPTDGPSRIIALQQHMNIQLTATACILFGFAAIYANKVGTSKTRCPMALLCSMFAEKTHVYGFSKRAPNSLETCLAALDVYSYSRRISATRSILPAFMAKSE
jgi:hypothetical protein